MNDQSIQESESLLSRRHQKISNDFLSILIYYIIITPKIIIPLACILIPMGVFAATHIITCIAQIAYVIIEATLPANIYTQIIACCIVWILVYAMSKALGVLIELGTARLHGQEAGPEPTTSQQSEDSSSTDEDCSG